MRQASVQGKIVTSLTCLMDESQLKRCHMAVDDIEARLAEKST